MYQKDRSSNISLTEEQFIRGFLVAINKKGISLKAPWQKKVRNILVSEIKCFCLSEVNDNLLMWAHYSESHKGGLIGFNDREAKSFIKDARPVTYSKYYPVEHNPAAKVRSLLGRKNLNREVEEYWHKTFYSKGKIWSYEKEYRVIMTLSQVDENNLAELPVEVFDSIYLGCMMSDEIKKKIIEIRNNKYPHASIYQSLLHEEEYQLIFSPI